MTNTNKPLATYLQPALDEARLARQYARVVEASRISPVRSSFRFAIPVLALALGVVVWLVAHRTSSSGATADGTVVEVGSHAGEALTLRDGTRIVLAENTKLTLTEVHQDRVRLDVASGGIDLDVTHVPGRSFVVVAAHYTVTVVGTRFEVTYIEEAPRRLAVRVTRGRVKVEDDRGGEGHYLEAGQTWSAELEPRGAVTPNALPLPPAVPAIPSAPATEALTPAAPSAPSASAGERLAATPRPHTDALPAGAESAKDLLVRAQAARAAGNPREAAALLDTLRRKHRSDSRAGLAAFELGRVRLDALKDPGGAVEAFDDAIAIAPNAPFRDDAEARRVQAIEATGNVARCVEARQGYLDRFPLGLHGAEVRRRCGGS
jgi:tetratricopeptide (TPR) repeat protein